MHIRNATYRDAPSIKLLMAALGYQTTTSLLINQLESIFNGISHQIFVCELNNNVAGFIAVHFLPQLASGREVLLITDLVVDASVSERGIGKALEQHVCQLAFQRNCEQVQVHCPEWQAREAKFYLQLGYREHPRYYIKQL